MGSGLGGKTLVDIPLDLRVFCYGQAELNCITMPLVLVHCGSLLLQRPEEIYLGLGQGTSRAMLIWLRMLARVQSYPPLPRCL